MNDLRLLDLLEDAVRPQNSIMFLPSGESVTFDDIWRRAARAGSSLSNRVGAQGTVAVMMSSAPDAIATLLGAWRYGLTVASLPLPARGQSADEYAADMRELLTSTGATVLVVDDGLAAFAAAAVEIDVATFTQVCAWGGATASEAVGGFVQCTSGTTGRPRGIRLELDAIGANVVSILARLQTRDGDAAVSWLPLSHDMGLIGMLLSSVIAGGRRWVGEGRLVLIQPEAFLADATLWLESCADVRATVTASPAFGLSLARRALHRLPPNGLAPLRAVIVGAEPVPATVLREFEGAARDAGFSETALCPAYGLAEASLAVTLASSDSRWTSCSVDSTAVWDGQWTPHPRGVELVGCGEVLEGMTVHVEGTVGRLSVDGPSLMSGYVGNDEPVARPHPTGDIGAMIDGELYVVGRYDDVIVVRGRQFSARDLERTCDSVVGLRAGTCVAVADPDGGYAIVAELTPAGLADNASISVRRALVDRWGVAPSRVMFVERGTVPKTASGKPRHHLVAAALAAGTLAVLGHPA